VREYFERMRPRLAASEATQAAMDHLMNADVIFPPMPTALKPGAWMLAKTLRLAIIATLPRWHRDLAGLRQPRIVDVLIRPVMRAGFAIVAGNPRLEIFLVGLLSPATVPVAAPMLLGIKPVREETLTPVESFERHGVPDPAALYDRLKADQETIIYPPSAPSRRAGAAAGPARARELPRA